MPRGCSWIVVAAAALAACDRPSPLVICHNVNCAAGPDVSRDDTLEALDEALALEVDGRTPIDGVEFDTFWYGAESRCLFAHDLEHDTTTPATAAADRIAQHLATTAVAAANGERFYAIVELKMHVGPELTDAHTPAQLILHAECALDVLDRLVAGARAGGHQLTVGFVSAVPQHLEVLRERPRWQAAGGDDLELLLVGDIFAPYASVVPELADYRVPLDAVEVHPDFLTDPHRETYRSLDIDLVQWSLVTTTEALDAIERWEPRFVLTNEAVLLRDWIAN
jgi:hypothetical protein